MSDRDIIRWSNAHANKEAKAIDREEEAWDKLQKWFSTVDYETMQKTVLFAMHFEDDIIAFFEQKHPEIFETFFDEEDNYIPACYHVKLREYFDQIKEYILSEREQKLKDTLLDLFFD